MIVEVLALSAAATAGRAAWRRWNRQRAARRVQTLPDTPRPPRRVNRDVVESSAVAGALVAAGAAKAGSIGLLSTAGRALAGPLAVASVPLLIVGSRTMATDGWAALTRRRRLEYVHLDIGLTVVGLVNGSLVVAAIGSAIYQMWHVVGTAQQRDAERHAVNRASSMEQGWLDVGSGVAVLADTLEVGDRLVLRPGDVVPVDVKVQGGLGRLDLRAPTGQLMPLEASAGRSVPSGAVVMDGRLTATVERPHRRSTATTLRSARRRLELELEPIALRGKRAADASVSFSVLSAALAGLFNGYWSALGAFAGNTFAAYRLTAPLGLTAHVDHQLAQGIQITDGRAFEQLAGLDVLALDLSVLGERDRQGRARLEVATVWWPAEGQALHPLSVAGALLAGSDDPMRAAVLEGLARRGRASAPAEPVVRRASLYRTIDARPQLIMGPVGALAAHGHRDRALEHWADRMAAQGHAALGVVVGDEVIGGVAFAPTIRPEWAEVVEALARRGVQPMLVAADPERAVAAAASALGVPRFVGGLDPGDKRNLVEGLQAAGHLVGYVGAELADRPAMAAADVCLMPREADRTLHDAAGLLLGAVPPMGLIHLIDAARDYHRGQGRALALSGVLTIATGTSTVLFGVGLLPVVAVQGLTIATNLALTRPRKPLLPPAPEPELASGEARATAPLTPQPA